MPYLAQDSKGMSAKGRLHSDLSSNRLACSVYLTDTAHSLFLHIDNTGYEPSSGRAGETVGA